MVVEPGSWYRKSTEHLENFEAQNEPIHRLRELRMRSPGPLHRLSLSPSVSPTSQLAIGSEVGSTCSVAMCWILRV
ncbi:hypothetical protein E2C01_011814 [Portunus trituberculatus]|uniref:Uncharacterized protein n=1 Tax=Portunus trituberculatus TaxID=210409 RepID=A0A5B7DCZ6_PORTR|nr:hypothetical protein [Portunus trituberculatus]